MWRRARFLLSLGGKGVISVMANIIPKDTHKIVKAFFDNDIDTCRELQIKTVPIEKALFCETNPIPIKAAMNLMGFDVGKCRLPLVEMSDCGVDKLKDALIEYQLIKA